VSALAPVDGRLRTRCAVCKHEFYIGASIAMRMGLNTGHCTCPSCKTFLHCELLEGDEAWTERHSDWLKRAAGISDRVDLQSGGA
jgi:hypothetical protein